MKRALVLLLLSACTGPMVGAVRTNPSSAQTIFTLTNQTRVRYHLSPLVYSERLAEYAQIQSAAMAARGHIFHSEFSVAENVGEISADPGWERKIHAAFMASYEHRFNVLDSRLKTVGIAVVISDGFAWVTEEFLVQAEPTSRPTPTCSPIVRTDCSYRFTP